MDRSNARSADASGQTRDLTRGRLTTLDAAAVVIGVVVGAGVFKTPSLVASRVDTPFEALAAWTVGGVVSLIGALCYAELTATYPDEGGEYRYLRRAFGPLPSFLFAWARMTVIQTGSIAMMGFLVGDYMSEIWRLGRHSAAVYAGLTVAVLTGLNAVGVRQGGRTQRLFMASDLACLLILVAAGMALEAAPAEAAPASGSTAVASFGDFGAAMVFVMLTYGGWNEAAYLSADLRDPGRDTLRALVVSLGLITVAYLAVNVVFLRTMGLRGVAESPAAAADLMRRFMGEDGARLISLFVALTALSTMNGSMITGARTAYALGRDAPSLAWLGRWRQGGRGPVNALLAQGLLTLVLVVMGGASRGGFELMVEYTAPVFWLFFLLVTLSVLALRRLDPDRPRPYRTPLYPLTPLLFAGVCAWMLWSSLAYTGWGALGGLAVLGAGLPVWFALRSSEPSSKEVET